MLLSLPMYFTLMPKPIKGSQNVSSKTVSRRTIFLRGQLNNLVLWSQENIKVLCAALCMVLKVCEILSSLLSMKLVYKETRTDVIKH